jgi:serine/threonine protein kinase
MDSRTGQSGGFRVDPPSVNSDAAGYAYRLVEQALDLPEAERTRFIRQQFATGQPASQSDSDSLAFALGLLRKYSDVSAADRRTEADGGEEARIRIDPGAFESLSTAEALERRRPRLADGATISHFRIGRFVASGGMGEVYEAEDMRLRRRVAIKVLPSRAGRMHAARFAREAVIMARVEHPAIARLFDWGVGTLDEGDGSSIGFIAMEFIEGTPLAEATERIRAEHPRDPRPIVELMLPIVDAVAHAHARGVLHRDIKPANILVDQTGKARLLDFGVASFVEQGEEVLRSLSELPNPGTLLYMSPEQVHGGACSVTTRSDIYGLGLTLHESFSGRRVVESGERGFGAIIEQILHHEPPSLNGGRAGAARGAWADLDFIIRKSLRKAPDERYQSADALGDDLRRLLRGERPIGRTPALVESIVSFVARHRRKVAGAALLAAAGGAAIAFGASQYIRAREAEARSELFVGSLLEGSRPMLVELPERLIEGNHTLEARSMVLKAAAAYLEWISTHAGNDPRVLAEIARNYRQFGLVAGATGQGSFGDPVAAGEYLSRSTAILDELLAVRPDKDLLLLRARVRREQAGLVELEKRVPFFRLAIADQSAAIALMPAGDEHDAAERFLLITQLQAARMAMDLDGFAQPIARIRELAVEPRMQRSSDFMSELGLGERYYADVLDMKGRIEESLVTAQAAQRAFESSIALGLDGFTNHRHLARIELLISCRTASERPLAETMRQFLDALGRGRKSTSFNPRDSFYRLCHIETVVCFAETALIVAEEASVRDGEEARRAFIDRAISAIDEELRFAKSLPIDGAPHMREEGIFIDLTKARRALETLLQ